ncbi:hypothetical protein ACFOWE_02560 [Planomonospora corallina]|uniref:DUF8094 domain-containing protein n=1 Tax=Planomonospora corallina TaxID=1806052 RepID=A0ABV8HZ01_9ACTN
MSRHASDSPDRRVWHSWRIDAPAVHDFDGDGWEPERLSTFRWRKVVLFTTAAAAFSAAGVWIVLTGPSTSRTVLTGATPAPDKSAWEAVVPPPDGGAPGRPPSLAATATAENAEEKDGQDSPSAEKTAAPVEPEVSTEPPDASTGPSIEPSTAPSAALSTAPSAAPSAVPSATPSGAPPVEALPTRITTKDARRVHGRWAQDLSRAQVKMDDKAMGKLEHGLALEMSRAAFETARMENAQVPSGLWPRPEIWVPRDSQGSTDWFVAVSHQEGVARISIVLASTTAGWRATAFTADTRPVPAELPELATDAEGYATSLPEDASGLAATPRQVARAHLASLESTEPDARFADGPWTSEAALFWRQERAQLERAGWRLSLTYRQEGPVRSLMTSDGGALIWYAARSTDLRTARRAGALVTLKGAAAVRTGSKAFAHSASVTYGRMYVAYVPPAGSDEQVRVLGEWSEVLESHGT